MIRMSSLRNIDSNAPKQKPKYTAFDLLNASEKGDITKITDIIENSTLSITDVKNNEGKTALHVAAKFDRIDVMKLLLEKTKESVNITDYNNNTPLLLASFQGNNNMIKLLLNALADVNFQNKYGNTPLIGVFFPPFNNMKECLVQLLDRKANTSIQNAEGTTALLNCAACGDVDCFKLLLGRGSNIQETNNNRRNSMHLAVLNFSSDLLNYLISEYKELASQQDDDGNTPLHICCYIGYTLGLRILLSSDFYKSNKKYLEIKNNYGHSALFVACGRGNKNIVTSLINSGAEVIIIIIIIIIFIIIIILIIFR